MLVEKYKICYNLLICWILVPKQILANQNTNIYAIYLSTLVSKNSDSLYCNSFSLINSGSLTSCDNATNAPKNSCANNTTSQSIDECSQAEEAEMKSITIEEYRRLLNDTIELYKAKSTIKRLELSIKRQDDKIKNLQKRLEAAENITDNLSPVSTNHVVPQNSNRHFDHFIRKQKLSASRSSDLTEILP